ncbi:hypothetical protein evm_005878 [Chilo suppressalis]|nr:hypothetical protein evm_005878 [Chilo suppressalis]
MKILLAVIGVLVSGVLAEPEAPYPASGFRPIGPAFELPQKNTQPQEYLPPVEPRRPVQNPYNQYGPPEEEDVSVQGLPAQEQQPIFQVSPINGQLYVGPQFNSDLRNLDSQDSFRFNQYQLQQEKYRQLERQRQLEAAQARTRSNQVPSPQTPQVPRQFAQPAPTTTESAFSTKNLDESGTSTPAIELNEGETFEDSNRKNDDKNKVTVEVSKQKLQEYPGELFLSSLAQLQLQPQFVPIQQFGQLNAPLQYQPIQQEPQQVGYDARTHFAALPSVLAQRQSLQPQNQQGFVQNPALYIASQDPSVAALVQAQQSPNQYQPFVNNQYQPLQPQVYPQPMTVPPPQQYQPNFQSQQSENDESRQEQDQAIFYQQSYQPQEVVYQSQYPQGQPMVPNQQQEQQNYPLPQAQLLNYPQLVQQYQNGYNPQQFAGQQQVYQGQDNLQSGLDVNQQGNSVDDTEERNSDDENRDDDGSMAVAVATAFGARTQPRVLTRYGAPIPRVTADSQPTMESTTQDEEEPGNPAVVAQANAFANGRSRSAKLRSRRVRPIFTLDRSGHLVLAQDQN